MAVINQSPSGQTSVAISGISFTGLVVGSGDPFREPAVRVQDGGASVAISFGSVSVTTEALIAGMVSVINPLGITEITTSPNLPPGVVNLDEENLVAVADDDSPSLTIFGATLP